MFNFIRLQLKLKWGLNKNNSRKNAIMTAILALVAVAIVLALVWGLTYVLKNSLTVGAKELSVLFLSVLMIGLTVVATGMQLNRLYRPSDINITARFPLSSFKIFICYLILNYIDLCIYSFVLLVPVMLIFGWAMGCITFTYVLGILLGAILLPIVPFGLSIIIAIPIIFINSLLKRHNIVKLIFFILFLVACFSLYAYVLNILAQFFIHRNWQGGTIEIWQTLINGLNSYYNPAYYLSNVIFFNKFWLGLGALVGASIVLVAVGVFIAKLVYQKIRTKELDGGGEVYRRKSKIDNCTSGWALFKHTFKEILQTKQYSYFYLGVAISTPVMVFLCNRLVTMVGEAQIGKGINFGASILVVAVFMAMISSFSAQVFSVEGRNFYITKLVPISYRKQLLIKGVLHIIVSLVALVISVVLLAVLKFLTPIEILVLTISQLIFVVGLVFNGINMNLLNPNLKLKANGETEEINITYMLLIGFVIAAIFGTVSLLLPKFSVHGDIYAYIIDIAVGLVYAIVNFVVFWLGVNKKYKKIEV